MRSTPVPVVVRPLFSALFRFYPQLYPAPTEPHISLATLHLRHMLPGRSVAATRREDWVLLRDTSPGRWATDGPHHLQLQRHLAGVAATPDRQFPSRPGIALSSHKSQLLGRSLLSRRFSVHRTPSGVVRPSA
jgi:hypothetical protein